MRGYRDDLDAARRRIDYLEDQLAERAPRRRASPRKNSKRRGIRKYVLLVVAIAPLSIFALHRSGAVALEHAALSSLIDATHAGGTSAAAARNYPLMTRLGDRRCGEPSRYHGVQDLPADSHLLDFEQCAGCACCLTPAKDSKECQECSKEGALTRAGLITDGVRQNKTADGLRAIERYIRIILQDPVTLFAATARPTFLSGQGRPGTVKMTARDATGEIVDTFEATHATDLGARTPDGRNERARSFLVVEACNGATITSVDVEFSEYSMVLANLAYYSR